MQFTNWTNTQTLVKRLLPLLTIGVALTACSSNQNVPSGSNGSAGGTIVNPPNNNPYPNGGYGNGNNNSGNPYPGGNAGGYNNLPGGGSGSGAGGSYDPSLLNTRIVYFDYDSARIRPDALAVIRAHARHLAKMPGNGPVVRLEGHADERGSREYNVALSLRRAEAVAKLMQLEGPGTRGKTIGYGEEIPAVFGHNPAAWDKNRRVEIKY